MRLLSIGNASRCELLFIYSVHPSPLHLHERHHNEKFRTLMDTFMPKWRLSRDVLKREPLAYEAWEY